MWHTKVALSAKHIKHAKDGKDTLYALLKLAGNELMPNYKNIKIHKDTHERLKSHGNMGESFDDLINRILDDWEEEESEGSDE